MDGSTLPSWTAFLTAPAAMRTRTGPPLGVASAANRVSDCAHSIRYQVHRQLSAKCSFSSFPWSSLAAAMARAAGRAESEEPVDACSKSIPVALTSRRTVFWDAMPNRTSLPFPTFGHALRAASPTSAVVVSSSQIPDIGLANVAHVAKWLNVRGIDAARRGLVLHYRAGRLLGESRAARASVGSATRSRFVEIREPGAVIAADVVSRLRGPGISEGFWQTFWAHIIHSDSLKDARAHVVCRERAGRSQSALAACSSMGDAERTRLFDEWCSRSAPTAAQLLAAAPHPEVPMLLLGGDAHYDRETILRRLWNASVLSPGRALWSLSTPNQCGKTGALAAPKWRAFCALFPKVLDIRLEGPLGDHATQKDVRLPPASLYDRTRFSVVFESVVSTSGEGPRNFPLFLTEKVLKPLIRGHPFVTICAAPGVWELLAALGFRDFTPTLHGELPHDSWLQFPCDEEDGGAYGDVLAAELSRLQALPDSAWGGALEAAAHNQRHALCPAGLATVMKRLERNVLRFVERVAQGKVDPGSAHEADSAGRNGRHGRNGRKVRNGGKGGRGGAPCEDWCKAGCLELHGNLYRECKGCDATIACHKGAEGYDTWPERARAWYESTRRAEL